VGGSKGGVRGNVNSSGVESYVQEIFSTLR